MSSVNKDDLVNEYINGASLLELASLHNIPASTVRNHILKAGVLRSRSDGIKNASSLGKLGSGLRGKTRNFSEQHKANISKARLIWSDENAVGYSLKPNGYYEYTKGEHKGRLIHVVLMENRIGRRLLHDEHVHHIDGVKTNNSENNLALMTKSGHARIHRIQDEMSGVFRERDDHGRFR